MYPKPTATASVHTVLPQAERLRNLLGTHPKRHPQYQASVEMARQLAVHAEGRFPQQDLQTRRPGEPPAIHAYRQRIFKPRTLTPFHKVLHTLSGVRRAEGFARHYPNPADAPNPLGDYLERHFPYFGSVEDWAFQVALQRLLADPNAWVVVLPQGWLETPDLTPSPQSAPIPKSAEAGPDAQIHGPQPVPHLFGAADVVDSIPGQWLLVRTAEKSWIRRGETDHQAGEVYWALTPEALYRYEQTGQADSRTFRETRVAHPLGALPAFQLGGRVRDFQPTGVLYESFIQGVLPYWDEALRLYSDHQANLVMHVHPEKAVYLSQACPHCQGKGVVQGPHGHDIPCHHCEGSGIQAPSPFAQWVVHPTQPGESPAPFPPAAYVTKPVETIRLLKEEVEDNIRGGYAALNMEFLCEVPLGESGVAKAYDRQELNHFLYTVAQHIQHRIIGGVIHWANEWINAGLSPEARAALLPTLLVPSSFDVVSDQAQAQELAQVRQAGLASAALYEVQRQYLQRKLGTDDPATVRLNALRMLDPLPDLNPNEKAQLAAAGAIRPLDLWVSVQLERLLNDALASEPDFLSWQLAQQRAWLETQATALMQPAPAHETIGPEKAEDEVGDERNEARDAEEPVEISVEHSAGNEAQQQEASNTETEELKNGSAS
jgi:hypothetical protein